MFSKTFSRAIRNGSCYKGKRQPTLFWCNDARICIIKTMCTFNENNFIITFKKVVRYKNNKLQII